MWPSSVGIKAIEVYFPAQYVDQTELEKFDGVGQEKYTVGLGQSKMGFCDDREDINSLCLTVLHNLMERNDIKPKDIGRLEVGTETLIDKSKSVKTVLMQLFEPYGCVDIEGVDSINACYGGTAALFNSISWIESSAWDGRLAVVVMADSAVYSEGSARPTGGAGAIAIAVGPDAPLIFDRGMRVSCMRHTYDFYKPVHLHSEFPIVDGQLSIKCYLNALDSCYQKYTEKFNKQYPNEPSSLSKFDVILFHSPYCKLVQKSFARLAFIDFLNAPTINNEIPDAEELRKLKLEDTYSNKKVEKIFMNSSKSEFEKKTQPSLLLANQIGNMYTPSVYSGLISVLISKPLNELFGNSIGIFSYGSGFASSMYSLRISQESNQESNLRKIVDSLSHVELQLKSRRCISPEDYSKILKSKEKSNHVVPFEPKSDVENMFPGTYYLIKVDDKHRRTYDRIPKSQ